MTIPIGPRNLFVINPYIKGTLDIVWDDALILNENIVGYNVYRATHANAEFFKLNSVLVNTNSYRDQITDVQIIEEDVSSQFVLETQLNGNLVNDQFTGDSLDKKLWTKYDDNNVIGQFDELIFFDSYGGHLSAYVDSNYYLKGDFDVQIDFTLFDVVQPTNSTNHFIAFKIIQDESNYLYVSRKITQNVNVYEMNIIIGGVVQTALTTSTNDKNGKFRITRTGKIYNCLKFDGNVWNLLGSYSDMWDTNVTVRLFFESPTSTKSQMSFDNFVLNSGLPILMNYRNPQNEYVIQVSHFPIVDSSGTNNITDDPKSVSVTINGQNATVEKVIGNYGEIYLNVTRAYDHIKHVWYVPLKPIPKSIIKVTYQYNTNNVKFNLGNRLCYKVTSVDNESNETLLSNCTAVYLEADKKDYIVDEMERRNYWLLDQVGEQVKLFVKKTAGERCTCWLSNERLNKQASNDCQICWGTGFVGGYVNPYQIKISPAMSEDRISFTERGLQLVKEIDVWTICGIRITQRDFILRRNGQVFSISPVTTPEIRGTLSAQQHFNIGHIDTTDIRYKFINQYYESNSIAPVIYTNESSELVEEDKRITDKSTVSDVKEIRGRTRTFGNLN